MISHPLLGKWVSVVCDYPEPSRATPACECQRLITVTCGHGSSHGRPPPLSMAVELVGRAAVLAQCTMYAMSSQRPEAEQLCTVLCNCVCVALLLRCAAPAACRVCDVLCATVC